MSDLSQAQAIVTTPRPRFPGGLQEILDELHAARMEMADDNREALARAYEWLLEVLKECTPEMREALIAGEEALEHAAYLARHPEEA